MEEELNTDRKPPILPPKKTHHIKSTPYNEQKLGTLAVTGTGCIGKGISKYHMIIAKTAPITIK